MKKALWIVLWIVVALVGGLAARNPDKLSWPCEKVVKFFLHFHKGVLKVMPGTAKSPF